MITAPRAAAPSGPAPIRQLDADLAARIAAGEVIERPASVVKELLENALDAGATRVSIELEEGGQALIRVRDDGWGIAASEVALAFCRHATSKMSVLDDLMRLHTLGFRGEALPSIAAVAAVEVATRAIGAAHGVVVTASGASVSRPVPRGLPQGTTISVRDLFAAVPARLKFLKSRSGEVSAVQGVVAHYAMAYPQVALTLYSDGRVIFASPGSGALSDVLVALYGGQVAERLLELRGEGRESRVEGVISPPDLHRPSRAYQSFFVNGRWVRNRLLSVALEEAYRTHLMVGRHPLCVVHLTLSPEVVDVNVHPTKAEVKFLYEREVFAAIRNAASAVIVGTMPQPGKTLAGIDRLPDAEGDVAAMQGTLDLGVAAVQAPPPSPRDAAGAAVVPPRADMLPLLRVLGQANNLYIIAEGPDGVYMVDQHAAHERVLFDELCAAEPQRPLEAQFLLEPLVVELSAAQYAALEEGASDLAALGFAAEPFGAGAGLVRAVPALLQGDDVADALCTLLEERVGAGGEQRTRPEWRERSLATIACKSAVKAGQALSLEEMRRLIYRLETTARPRTCPHGRPTMILLSASQLEREFGRRG